jgi:hypothetical protein
MATDEPNPRSATTIDSTSSTSSASSLFNLDENDKRGILVYKYRMDKKALEVTSQHDLCKELDAGELLPWSCTVNYGWVDC